MVTKTMKIQRTEEEAVEIEAVVATAVEDVEEAEIIITKVTKTKIKVQTTIKV